MGAVAVEVDVAEAGDTFHLKMVELEERFHEPHVVRPHYYWTLAGNV